MPTHALSIKPRWLDLILSGEKTVELRGKGSLREDVEIGLIQSGSGCVVGSCTFVRAEGPVDKHRLLELAPRHCYMKLEGTMTADEMIANVGYATPHAWHLKGARRWAHPVPYKHPQGAQWPRALMVPGFKVKRERARPCAWTRRR